MLKYEKDNSMDALLLALPLIVALIFITGLIGAIILFWIAYGFVIRKIIKINLLPELFH